LADGILDRLVQAMFGQDPANVFAIDDGYRSPLFGQGPGEILGALTAA